MLNSEIETKRLISVITVCYNEENTIIDTMESLYKQSSSDFEYVIKDGKSSDSTNRIIERYISKFESKNIPVKHIVEADSGIYNAMNTASVYCTGKYIIFLNSGDVLYNEHVIENCIKKMKENSIDIYYGDAVLEDEAGKAFFYADMSLIKRRMPFVHQASFINRETFQKYGYNEKYKICADYDMFLTLYNDGKRFQNLHEIICLYNANGLSSTKFLRKRIEHEEILFKKGNNNLLKSSCHILEACIKEILMSFLPKHMLIRAKQWYKWRIKGYGKWEKKT